MPEPEAAQQLIDEHITPLGEQNAQLERALGHLQGSTGAEGQGPSRGQGQRAGTRKGRQAQGAVTPPAPNARRAPRAAAK